MRLFQLNYFDEINITLFAVIILYGKTQLHTVYLLINSFQYSENMKRPSGF